LLHLTDSTTNNQYNCDNYFAGIEFDLSRILFIFTYNDPNNVDPIFADRIYKINITNYSYSEKFSIIQNHLINNILKSFNFKNDDISFTEESIKYLIEKSKNSDGMRTIKNNIQIIISRINTLLLIDESQANVIQLNYKKLYKNYRKLPVLILKYHIDLLLEDSIYEEYTELKYPHMYL
jgi:ATP-dependent Lon protease